MLMIPLWPQGLKGPFKSMHTKGRGGNKVDSKEVLHPLCV